MRSEFQDVFKDAYDHWIDDACSHRYHASKSLALQVWQHQQSKVDELQKRVDGIKKIVNDAVDSDGNSSVEMVWDGILELEQALKGGSNA